MRVLERTLSLLVAILLIALAVVVTIEVIWALVGQPPAVLDWRPAYTNGAEKAWETAPVRIAAIAATVLGLLLLLVGLKPRRPSRMALVSVAPGVDTAVTRRGLSTTLVRAAKEVDGIGGASAKIGRRSATVKATSRAGHGGAASSMSSAVEQSVQARLSELQLARPPKVRTRVAARSGSRSA